jgi:hypothetical protein
MASAAGDRAPVPSSDRADRKVVAQGQGGAGVTGSIGGVVNLPHCPAAIAQLAQKNPTSNQGDPAMRLGIWPLVLLSGLGTAQAATLSGGPIEGGVGQRTAVCYFFNAGNSSVTLGNPRITNVNGTAITLTINQCTSGSLAPLRTCGIAAPVSNSTIYDCTVSVTPSKKDVRGVLEMRDGNGVTLQNVQLR